MSKVVINNDDYKACMLEKNRVYFMKIVKVTDERGRTFTRPGTTKKLFVFDVYMEDSKGGKFKAEYASETNKQEAFVEGVSQYFQCSQSGNIADEIIPHDPDESVIPKAQLEKVVAQNRNLSIAGTTYSCAIICAKDLMAAELHACPGSLVDEGFKVRLFDLAEEIDSWLLAKRDM